MKSFVAIVPISATLLRLSFYDGYTNERNTSLWKINLNLITIFGYFFCLCIFYSLIYWCFSFRCLAMPLLLLYIYLLFAIYFVSMLCIYYFPLNNLRFFFLFFPFFFLTMMIIMNVRLTISKVIECALLFSLKFSQCCYVVNRKIKNIGKEDPLDSMWKKIVKQIVL